MDLRIQVIEIPRMGKAAWAVSTFSVASPPIVRYSVATINGAHRGLDGRGRLTDLARILQNDAVG